MATNKILLTAASFFSIASFAQQSVYFSSGENYKNALAEELYQSKIYNASQYEYSRQYFFNENLNRSQKEAAQFFDNVIGVILEKTYAKEGLAAFIKQYPNSAYFAQANLPLADYYLAQKDFESALETLLKVNQYQLSQEENTQYIIKLGYAKYMSGDSQGAIEALEEAYQQEGLESRSEVAYMLGHLYYAKKDNDKAFEYFNSLKEEPKFASVVRPYYVQLYFNDKNYDQAIIEGKELLDSPLEDSYRREVNKIIGESYFFKGEYDNAYPYLKEYLSQMETPSESDLYQMGFVSAQAGKYEEAVNYYNRLINSTSPLAQNAYYQLGNAYLQTDRKAEALSAFRSAYQMTYDPSIQKMAHEQYAKLSYDVGNPFEPAPRAIQNYITKYPSDATTGEMNQLLVKSYLYSGSYRETLEAIDKLPNSTAETDKIDQEVSFLLGTEEFNKGNLDEAEHFFLRSLEYHLNPEFHNRAQYWLAQTYYQKENYPSSIVRFQGLSGKTFPESKQLPYDLGYAYFKSGDFARAQEQFKLYLENPQEAFEQDAKLRLADTYYAENQLNEAIALYDTLPGASDYTMFQKAMALGFKGDSMAKIESLKELVKTYPNSEYTDDAKYEIAVAYASNEQYEQSDRYFQDVIDSSGDKDLIADAQLYKVQNQIAQGYNQNALAALEKLGKEYQNTSYASKIVLVARPLFIESGDVSGYQKFAENLGVRIEASDIDEANLAAARQLFTQKEYAKAIPLYERYLTQRPTGLGLYQAQYELGESFYQLKNFAKSLLVLSEVANVQNDYQQEAQTRIAQIHIAQGNADEALAYLKELEKSSNINLRSFAQKELMSYYAEKGDLANAQNYATKILSNSKNSASVRESAQVINARALLKAGKEKEAQGAYASLEKSSNSEVAAEALWGKAYFQNKAKAYKASNETIFKLANNYASEEYWGAKALVVMAKNYLGLKDNYQASYTVDQIIANYKDFPEVVAEAREVKKSIK